MRGQMAEDVRREFVVSAVLDAVAPSHARDHLRAQLSSDPSGAMGAFLDDQTTTVLQATLVGDAVTCANVVSFDTSSTAQVVLTKLRPGSLRPSDIPHAVSVSSMAHSPVSALYHQLRQVYGPMLGEDAHGASPVDAKLRGLVADLEAGCRNVMRLTGGVPGDHHAGRTHGHDPADSPLEAITSPLDEFSLWSECAYSKDVSERTRTAANEVYRAFEPVKTRFENLDELSDEDVLELVDEVGDALDAAWRVPSGNNSASGSPGGQFPRRRAEHLMRIVGQSLVGHVQARLREVSLWSDGFKSIEGTLRFGHRCLAKWERTAADLTELNWREGTGGCQHWTGQAFRDPELSKARERLDEVFRMREAQAELAELLSPEEVKSLALSDVFGPFAHLDPLRVSEYTAPLWEAARGDYDRRMAPIEERMSQKLREHFGGSLLPSLQASMRSRGDDSADAMAQPHQVLREVARYAELLRRPAVAQSLSVERNALADALERFLGDVKSECDARARSGDGPGGAGRNTTEKVEAVVWATQARERVAVARETCAALVITTRDTGGNRVQDAEQDAAGRRGSDSAKEAKHLLREIDNLRKTLFKDWQEGIVDRLGEFKLDLGSKLMDLDSSSTGQVKLHYNSELVSLLREVRQLSALGFTIRRDIAAEAETARKFYRHGMVLRQVANFYNNIASEMISCQKPMMLDDAVKFEEVLTNPRDGLGKVITWNNPTALEKYIGKLQTVAGVLTDKNRRLRKWHGTLGEKVCALFAMDLVRQKEAWKRAVKELRSIFANLEIEFRKDLQSAWRVHWDHQLYKALEYQYHRGLETLNEMLPQVNVSLVFKQRKLQFEPPLEEIRTAHYKQVKDFLNLPLVFKGVSDASEKAGFFRGMMDSAVGAAGCAKVYDRTEALFVKLADEQKKYEHWVALGTVDLDTFVDERFSESKEFEEGFRLVKSANKQADRIPLEIKVDCYTVSCLPLKSAVEKQIKELQDTLSNCLQRKVVRSKQTIEEFIRSGKELLDTKAQTIEEIGNMRNDAKNLSAEFQGKMTQLRWQVADLSKLLKQSGGSGAQAAAQIDFSSLDSEWENLSTKLEQLEAHLEIQKDNLKVQIVHRISDFGSKAEAFRERWFEFKPRGIPQGESTLIMNKLEDDYRSLEELKEEGERLRQDCEHFSMERPEFPVLDEVSGDVEATREAWSRIGDFNKEKNELAGRDWILIRGKLYELDDFLAKWDQKVRSSENKDAVAVMLLEQIEEYKKAIPALKFCRGEGWEGSHWAQLFSMLRFPTKGPEAVTRENLTLQHFLDRADLLIEKLDQLKKLHSQAQGEVTLREALHQLKVWGLDRRFTTIKHAVHGPRGGTVSLIKDWKDLFTEVADNQNLVSSLSSSPFFAPFKEETSVWETLMSNLADRLNHMNAIQRKWLYLQPIFARGALPQEQPRFRRVHEDFQGIMASIDADSLVKSFAEMRMREEHLHEMSTQLDMCQKALADYLEEKRSMLPRFYFIGDDDLLEILGQAKNPEVIQAHLKKLFAGIHSVIFTEGAGSITAMKSIAGEIVPLQKPVIVNEAVEVWLADLAANMVSSLSGMLIKCLAEKDYEAFPSQILSLADQVHFSKKAEAAISRGTLPALLDELQGQLQEYTSFDVEGMRVMQLKVQSLVMDLIHSIDVVEQLQKEYCSNVGEWVWQRQLRYYGEGRSGGVQVRMDNGAFAYSYEYQGNAPRLVYTPLTDKCYLTLTQGMHLGYGGNPYGPAGTGKTESVKALGQAMGRQVLVFNCDEEFDFKSMGRIFTGLLKCGAWGCFDEFNRLEEEVLSAVSSQIQTIQAALKSRLDSMTFLGKDIDVNQNAGIFVTLNPAGKGYGGRSKLPDNLKQLFRSVAMTVPNFELIAEVILLAEGFRNARVLGGKLVSLFSLSKQLLSPQQHYDWGLRALKTVLGIAGKLLRDARTAAAAGAGPLVDATTEAQIVIRATRVTTLPKLTFADGRRFADLLNDVYPGVEVSDVSDAELEAAIQEVLEEKHYENVPSQIEKVLQLHIACSQRIGIIIVGPSGSGKSSLWHILEGAYKKLGRPVKRYVMNPKAIHRQQLLGHMDMDTREWFDGVLTDSARRVVKESLDQHSWIICDGDVDPEWIESLNSVLDDNRLLTLPSGERIQFGSNVNFIFECDDLKFASPATVSRTAMLFLSEEAVEPSLIVKGWLSQQPEDVRSQLGGWCDEYFFQALDRALGLGTVTNTTKVGTIKNALSHVAGADSKQQFARGLARGFAANMDPAARNTLLKDLERLTGERDLLYVSAASVDRYDAPPAGIVDGKWRGVVMVDAVAQTQSLVVPWLDSGQPFVLVGPEGCGKAMVLEDCFARLRGSSVATLACSAQTTAANVIQKLAQCCGQPVATSGVTHRVLRPRDSERLVLYLKDINLPKPDKYDTIQLIAFLQQLLTYRGFYDESQEFIGLLNIQIVCSMNPATTVGRHAITTRFTAIAGIAYMPYMSRDEMTEVYSTMFAEFTQGTNYESQSQRRLLAETVLDVYADVTRSFSADDHRHYKFTPRTVTEWIQALNRYDVGAVDLLEALYYEAGRTFRDRLVGADAVNKFDSLIANVFRKHWRKDGLGSTGNVYTTWAIPLDEREHTMGVAAPMASMPADSFAEHARAGLLSYEREVKDLNIILFPEVLDRVARFNRVLSQPGGHLLLAGRSGAGRRSTASLVAHMQHMEFFSPKMTLAYDERAFKVDLKRILAEVAVENKETLLFIEDHQLVTPAILETVNSLLSSGEVPGLFTQLELDQIFGPLKDRMLAEGTVMSPFDFFTARVKAGLHIALSMDPSDPEWPGRTESNPALFTRCSMHWMSEWNAEGMRAVPEMLLREVFASAEESDECAAVVEQMSAIQNAVGGTPRQFVTFVDQYRRIFAQKREEHMEQRDHLVAGLQKLEEAADQVSDLSTQAIEQQRLLAEKQIEADDALQRITVAMSAASERKKEVEDLQVKLGKEETDLSARRGPIEKQLAEIQPMIDSARAAVGSIKSENISEVKSMRQPPETVNDVLFAVLTLMGSTDTSWTAMKRFLGGRGVKDEIINFDARNVTPRSRAAVQKLMEEKAASFEHKNILRASVAAAPLAAWAKANLKYSTVLEKIAPLEEDLRELSESLDTSRTRMAQCKQDLVDLDRQVVDLKNEFGRRTGEAEALKLSLKKAEDQLEAAERLLGKLGGEKTRWEEQVTTLETELTSLTRDCLLAAGFIAHLPSLPEDQRQGALAQWTSFLGVERFDLRRFMSTESEMLTWKAEGLPGDMLSMENAIVILNSAQAPLIIDPSTQASQWLKAHVAKDESTSLEVVTMHDKRFANKLELAVRFGKTLIIEEVDKIEPILYNVVRKDFERQGLRLMVQVGDKTVDYNESFRMYLMTRNPYPVIPPSAASIISEVNFTVTRSGLEGQLLGLVIQHEQPELEKQKSHLLQVEEDLKVQLAGLEKTLLETLATSTGNILENTQLITSLDETKAKGTTVKESLEESTTLQLSLDEQRNAYRPIAAQGSKLYFLTRDLRALNHMYQFSLNSFILLFKTALNESTPSAALERRIEMLSVALLRLVFGQVSRSIFNQDRLTFGMHFTRHLAAEDADETQWNYYFGLEAGDGPGTRGSAPSWVPENATSAYANLVSTFPSHASDLRLSDGATWGAWIDSPVAETCVPAADAGAFTRLLLVQALRPDRLQSAMDSFVRTQLGVESIAPPALSLPRVCDEADATTPVLFIVTPGSDPSQELEEHAERAMGRGRYHQLAMGQGQAEEAMRLLAECARTGDWLCLKNLHLVVAWLPTLEKEIYVLKAHEDFRLFLTSEPHAKFPSSLLEGSLKITYEAPPGLKRNVSRTYEAWSPQYISDGSPLRAKLLFLLAWFHAVVQERRAYVPQGWSKFYEFSFADLRSGADIINQACDGSADPQWSQLHGLLERAIYGGRVDSAYDIIVLRTYLRQFFSNEMTGGGGVRVKTLPGTDISLPNANDHGTFTALLRRLDEANSPSLFSLPVNVERTVQVTNSKHVITSLRTMASHGGTSKGFDRSAWSASLGPLLRSWDRMMAANPALRSAPGRTEATPSLPPIDAFVELEQVRGHHAVSEVDGTLQALAQVLAGESLLTPAIFTAGRQLMEDTVPPEWEKHWEGPEGPVSYCKGVVHRMVAVNAMVERTRRGSLLAGAVRLEEFFHPETFLNALRQQMARDAGVAIDTLTLVTSWDGSLGSRGVRIEGMRVQGAVFDGVKLRDTAASAPPFATTPTCALAWLAPGEPGCDGPTGGSGEPALHVPLYLTEGRERAIAEVQFPVFDGEEASKWILAGTACFLGPVE